MDKAYHLLLSCTNKLLAGLLTLLGFSLASCEKWGACEYGSPYAEYEIKGKVMNEAGETIPDIQVIIPDLNSKVDGQYLYGDTLKTNNGGEFNAKIGLTSFGEAVTFKVITKDIDGEKNGGLFEDKETEVAFKEEDLKGKSGNWYFGKAEKEVSITIKQAVKE